MIAKLRRELSGREDGREKSRPETGQKSTDAEPVFYQPELTLPVRLVWSDLTKTVAVTILALIVQSGLSVWLSRGGWQLINNLWFAGLTK